MKILIVEDEPSLRELIQRSLEKERYVVETAGDFNSALCKIEDYDYDCVLLDIMLPDGSGLELLERLKALHKRENVIIISAKDSLEDKVLGLELGADDYLPIFSSGWGDGYYPVYFGYDAKGKVCAVYVRFIDIEASYREQD